MKLSEAMDDFLQPCMQSICPVFCDKHSVLEQVGCGVLIRIGETVFLLTAAHVADCRNEGMLLIPGSGSLIHPSGHETKTKIPKSRTRNDDRHDIAYIRLLPEISERLDKKLNILNANACDLSDVTDDGDAYLISGYPYRKSDVTGNVASSRIYTFMGMGLIGGQYAELGLNTQHHLIVKYTKKKSVKLSTGYLQEAPDPEGMSGCGVFAWTKDPFQSTQIEPPKLVGILTEYYPNKHIFVSTRLNFVINMISADYPDLGIEERKQSSDESDIRKVDETKTRNIWKGLKIRVKAVSPNGNETNAVATVIEGDRIARVTLASDDLLPDAQAELNVHALDFVSNDRDCSAVFENPIQIAEDYWK